MPKKKPTEISPAHKRELKLIDELCQKHGYLFAKMDRKADRFTTIFRQSGRGIKTIPAIMMRVAVPIEAAYGKAMRDFYNDLEKKPKKDKPSPRLKR